MNIKHQINTLTTLPSATADLIVRSTRAVTGRSYQRVVQNELADGFEDLELGLISGPHSCAVATIDSATLSAKRVEKKSGLEELPSTVIDQMLSFLPIDDLKQLADTSTSLRKRVEQQPVWQKIEQRVGLLPLRVDAVRLKLSATLHTKDDELFLRREREVIRDSVVTGTVVSLIHLTVVGILGNVLRPEIKHFPEIRPNDFFRSPYVRKPKNYRPIAPQITQALCDTLKDPSLLSAFTYDGCLRDMHYQMNIAAIQKEKEPGLILYNQAVTQRIANVAADEAHRAMYERHWHANLIGAIAGFSLSLLFAAGFYFINRATRKKRAPDKQTPGLQRRRLQLQSKTALDLGDLLSMASRAGDVKSTKKLLRETMKSALAIESSSAMRLATGRTGNNALDSAIQAGQVKTSRLLIEAGYACSSNALDSAMMQADSYPLIKMLVSTAGLRPQTRHWEKLFNINGVNLFPIFAQVSDPRSIKMLLNQPATGTRVTYMGAALLMHTKDSELVKSMLAHGADVNLGSGWKQHTPLQLAVATQNYDAASILMQAGANPDQRDFGSKLSARELAEYAGPRFINLLETY